MTISSLTDTYTLSNGVKIPVVGFGTWQTPDGDVAYQSTLDALAAGYRHIDTAAAYGNEESIGRALKDSGIAREDIFVTSKLWNDMHGYESAKQALEEERVTALHDWLWLLASRRREGFSREPEMMAFYEEQLANRDVLLDPRLQDFALAVENIMAWDTFRNQRGMTIMQTFTYFYHPFFADQWDDILFKTLFETTWQEMLPVVEQGIVLNEEEN